MEILRLMLPHASKKVSCGASPKMGDMAVHRISGLSWKICEISCALPKHPINIRKMERTQPPEKIGAADFILGKHNFFMYNVSQT